MPKGHLPKEEALQVVRQLAAYGFEKITFAGGEPLLCPWLPELIKEAKQLGLITMVVSNGSRLTEKFLIDNKNYLDWIAVSIDSLDEATNLKIGRAIVGKRTLSKDYYIDLIKRIKHCGYGLKINTVVNAYNYQEDFTDFITSSNPKRWKVLQVLPIIEQNDSKVDEFIISQNQFNDFVNRHDSVDYMIPESNSAIKGSYVMVDPAGRFFDNANGKHHYSEPILEVGVKEAITAMNYDIDKFTKRGGIYDWES
ncbi:molybdenum cofactor biosynthesis enzyme [Nonlabens ulvanivorans]|uniref:S-adenosylmethionine-dependent nucleotide dehydratase n=1 Tax=Nonlabens ulvanivorans TaxID=906888 RepID=A0A090WBC1_NONUL|nr:molybdenum cofactor biosynthesis enzyme [Nonlabens ulvanivorans]